MSAQVVPGNKDIDPDGHDDGKAGKRKGEIECSDHGIGGGKEP